SAGNHPSVHHSGHRSSVLPTARLPAGGGACHRSIPAGRGSRHHPRPAGRAVAPPRPAPAGTLVLTAAPDVLLAARPRLSHVLVEPRLLLLPAREPLPHLPAQQP